MQHKVLAVDDQGNILKLLKQVLEEENISVITATDGESCIEKAKTSKPDLIILDIGLPDMDGFKVCKILRQTKFLSHIPVIFLTGIQTSSSNIAFALNEGACDYILKPFDNKVLVARVKVALRWLEYKGKVKEIVKKCGLEMDAEERRIKVNGKIVDLTQKEFDLIFTLVRNSGKVLSIQNLLETVWGYEDMAGVRTLISHISSLKRKLGPHCAKKVKTIKGRGYKLDA